MKTKNKLLAYCMATIMLTLCAFTLACQDRCCPIKEQDMETVQCPAGEITEFEEPQVGCGLSAVCEQPDNCTNCYDPDCQCCYEPGYPCYWNYNKYPWY